MPAWRQPVLLETRHVKAALSAMVIKTDRKDARGTAQLLRIGRFRSVHAKSPVAEEVRARLVARKLLQTKLLDVEFSIRAILRGFPTSSAATDLLSLCLTCPHEQGLRKNNRA